MANRPTASPVRGHESRSAGGLHRRRGLRRGFRIHHSWILRHLSRDRAGSEAGGTAYLTGEPLPSWLRYVVGGQFGHTERELGINETWIRRDVWLPVNAGQLTEPRIVFESERRSIEATPGKRGRRSSLAARFVQ